MRSPHEPVVPAFGVCPRAVEAAIHTPAGTHVLTAAALATAAHPDRQGRSNRVMESPPSTRTHTTARGTGKTHRRDRSGDRRARVVGSIHMQCPEQANLQGPCRPAAGRGVANVLSGGGRCSDSGGGGCTAPLTCSPGHGCIAHMQTPCGRRVPPHQQHDSYSCFVSCCVVRVRTTALLSPATRGGHPAPEHTRHLSLAPARPSSFSWRERPFLGLNHVPLPSLRRDSSN